MQSTKKRLVYLASLLLLFTITTPLSAYDDRDVYIESENYGQNLDLNAVASLFGKSRDLADFEWQLNDPSRQVSNLDLDRNGEVDYLRIIETSRHESRLIVIQAVVGRDRYVDVATIEVTRNRYNETSIQIIGDSDIYGDNYIVEPNYHYVPIIYDHFWGNRYYKPYYSRYKWGYYPREYRTWKPRPVPYHNRHIDRYSDTQNHYKQTQRNTQTNHMPKNMNGYDQNRHPERSQTLQRESHIDQRGVQENRSVRQRDYRDINTKSIQTDRIDNRQSVESRSHQNMSQMREKLHLEPQQSRSPQNASHQNALQIREQLQNNQREEKESSSHQNMMQMREKLHLQ